MSDTVASEGILEALLAGAGISLEQLRSAVVPSGSGPASALTLAEFYAQTVAPMARSVRGNEDRGGGTFRTFEPYWRLLVEGYPYGRKIAGRHTRVDVPADERLYPGCGDKPVRDVTRADVAEAVRWAVTRATLDHHWKTTRREDKDRYVRPSNQHGARRNAVGAYRYLVQAARQEQLLPLGYDPTAGIYKPPRSTGRRRAFTAAEYQELWTTVITGGDDPELDGFLVETVAVTGARREGLLNLRLRSLDPLRATIWLNEKGDRLEEQPATVDLVNRLDAFARRRGATKPSDPVFCYLDSTAEHVHALTSRRFDTLHQRIQRDVAWADSLGVTLHWFRHHAVSVVERVSSGATAARFARHRPRTVTDEYTTASMEEVCRAVAAITGTTHPLQDGGW